MITEYTDNYHQDALGWSPLSSSREEPASFVSQGRSRQDVSPIRCRNRRTTLGLQKPDGKIAKDGRWTTVGKLEVGGRSSVRLALGMAWHGRNPEM